METEGLTDGTRRRWPARWGLLTLGAVLVFIGAWAAYRPSEGVWSRRAPRLIVEDSVAGDFQALAEETWDRFLVVFRARADCFGDVRLRAAWTLDRRATYDPATATVTVRVPGTPAMLREALVHEWAHHVEFQCPAHRELRPAFLMVQGLPSDTPWRPDDVPPRAAGKAWADIPSEQYAEAVIELVLGQRWIASGAHVRREAVQVIAAWAEASDP